MLFPSDKVANVVLQNISDWEILAWQGGESHSIKGEISAGTSRRVVRGGGEEDNADRESSAGAHIYFHPCYYFKLAKLAVLKCLGLDPVSENSSTPQRRKSKEQ